MILLELVCVVCGCTDSKACEGGCSWVETKPPTCSTCAHHRMTAGARVEVKGGRFAGRVGVVRRVPRLEPMKAWRGVDLKPNGRAGARKDELILLGDLQEGRS